MNILNNKKGFTLIELIISLAVLMIILVAFISMFTNGFITVITMGNKSKATMEGQEIIDRVYVESDITNEDSLQNSISTILDEEGLSGQYVDYTDNITNFNEPNNTNDKMRFYVSKEDLMNTNDVFIINLKIYYQDFTKEINISSPIVRD